MERQVNVGDYTRIITKYGYGDYKIIDTEYSSNSILMELVSSGHKYELKYNTKTNQYEFYTQLNHRIVFMSPEVYNRTKIYDEIVVKLAPEIVTQIFYDLSYNDIKHVCDVNSTVNDYICQQSAFWKEKIIYDFGNKYKYDTLPSDENFNNPQQAYVFINEGWRGKYLEDYGFSSTYNVVSWKKEYNKRGDVYLFGTDFTNREVLLPKSYKLPIKSKYINLSDDRLNSVTLENKYESIPRNELTMNSVTKIASGSYHILFLLSNTKLYGQGSNYSQQLTPDLSISNYTEPVEIEVYVDRIYSSFTDIAAKNTHTLIMMSIPHEYLSYVFLRGTYDLDYNDRMYNGIISGLGKQICCGADHDLVIGGNDKVYSIGVNEYGQLGIPDIDYVDKLKKIDIPGKIIDIAAGSYHSLVLNDDRDIYVFGENYLGQLGVDYNVIETPIKLEGYKADKIFAGSNSSAFIDNGQIYVMGDNSNGKLGIDDVENIYKPMLLEGYTATQISLSHLNMALLT